MDETQAMPLETLETVRLLTNLETEKRKLMQVVLFGQPELDRKLASESMRQLRQRITFQHTLKALGRNEVADYVAHRLTIAGYSGAALFADRRAAARLHAASRGVPRLVNILAHKSLLLRLRRGRPPGRAPPRARRGGGHAGGHARRWWWPGACRGWRPARMSLINKMLQDLDRRQALGTAPDAAAGAGAPVAKPGGARMVLARAGRAC